jgi:hypothetical protein
MTAFIFTCSFVIKRNHTSLRGVRTISVDHMRSFVRSLVLVVTITSITYSQLTTTMTLSISINKMTTTTTKTILTTAVRLAQSKTIVKNVGRAGWLHTSSSRGSHDNPLVSRAAQCLSIGFRERVRVVVVVVVVGL